MVAERLPCETAVDVSVLGEKIKFPNGRVAANRIMKAAMTERLSSYSPNDLKEHGLPSETVLNMYQKWGNGGFGLILTGNVMTDPVHLESAGNVIICKENDSPRQRELLKRYASAIKSDGALAVVQLGNAGRQTQSTVNPHPKSASDVQLMGERRGVGFAKPTPYTEEEIQTEIVDRFVHAAKVCRDSGFDGIQLHGAHGYLLAQFMSPTTNKRTDKYGGSPENRVRVVIEIHDAIRKEIPSSTGFLVGIKMNSIEFQNDGLQTDDAKIMCEMMEKHGFDFVEMSGGTYEKLAFGHLRESTKAREAFFLDFTDRIRPVFKNTVMYVTGGFRTVKGMVDAVNSGSCCGIGMGRPVTAEPDLPRKILTGFAKSAADNKLDPQDFALTNIASNTQMWQAGLDPYNGNDVTEGIMDLTVNDTANNYKEAVKDFVIRLTEMGKAGDAYTGVLQFRQ